jgi:hypothetical protein
MHKSDVDYGFWVLERDMAEARSPLHYCV